MGLGIDEDWWAAWVAIGNPLRREAIDKLLGSRKGMSLALQKREGCAANREVEHLAAG